MLFPQDITKCVRYQNVFIDAKLTRNRIWYLREQQKYVHCLGGGNTGDLKAQDSFLCVYWREEKASSRGEKLQPRWKTL